MCLIAFSYQQHSQYKLIVTANRDEAYQRPTRAAQFWEDDTNILAGKDLKAGGSWMGIHRSGRFSAITNYRDPGITKEDPPSRGHLVLDFLKSSAPPADYLQKIDQNSEKYMGFNLLTGTLNSLYYYSNQEQDIRQLEPGTYGLSNHLLDTPWPKVQRAKHRLTNLIQKDTISENKLFGLLADDAQAPDKALPNTGIPQDIEKKVSPIFIKGQEYGTRCSTVLLINHNDEATFIERRFKPGTIEVIEENKYSFSIKSNMLSQTGCSRDS